MTRYISSDIHFNHNVVAKYRGYSSPEEMCEVIVNNWNSKITDKDDVYVLGDFSYKAKLSLVEQFIDRLNYSQLYFIMGNHDDEKMRKSTKFIWAKDYHEMSHNGVSIVLSHYPFGTWKDVHYGTVNFHGHCHGSYPKNNMQCDVGLDTNNLFPYSFDEVFAKMKEFPEFIIPDRL